jgi:hypothetical protein
MVWLCRRNICDLCCWEHRKQLNCEWICLRVIFKLSLNKWRLWFHGRKIIWPIYVNKIAVIGHDIWHNTMNNLTSWCSSERQLCTHTHTHTHTHQHTQCVVPPAYIQLCNPHSTPLYLISSNILYNSSKELEQLTSHYAPKALFSPLNTPTHTHIHIIKHCVYGMDK